MIDFFVFICFLAGTVSFIYLILDVSACFWKSVSVDVLHTNIKTIVSDIRHNQAVYSLVAEYQYELNGKRYTSRNVCLGGALKDSSLAKLQAFQDKLKRGEVEAKVFPAFPFFSVLFPAQIIFLMSSFSLFGFGVGLLTLWVEKVL